MWHLLLQQLPSLPQLPTIVQQTPGHTVNSQDALNASVLFTAWAAVSANVHLGVGQVIKQFPIPNKWLRWILPMLGVIGGGILPFFLAYLKYNIDPLSLISLIGSHVTGSTASRGLYEESQTVNPTTGVLGKIAAIPGISALYSTIATPGPNNSPLSPKPSP